MSEIEEIELRSERVRNIVGKIPPAIDRYGITVIGLVLAMIVAVSMLIPYQRIIYFTVIANDPNPSTCVAYVEPQIKQQLRTGMKVSIDVHGLKTEGIITSMSEKRVNGFHKVQISLHETDEIISLSELQASVILSEKSWFETFFSR